ncbi:hypothetical protein BZA77DRAFT_297403 [Pyronema omphalodes]|nr:hypothetical protein BZA77DRAFT_297403 [Pyronema omphalodes]
MEQHGWHYDITSRPVKSIYPPIYVYPRENKPNHASTGPSVNTHGGLTSVPSQVNSGIIPIDPILLQIDAHQRAVQGLPPFNPYPMTQPFAPPIPSGLRTVMSAGGPSPRADPTAPPKRKRVFASRKKPVAADSGIIRAAPTGPKRKQKPMNQQVRLPMPIYTTTEVTVPCNAVTGAFPPNMRRMEPGSAYVNVQTSNGGQVQAPSMFSNWMPLVTPTTTNGQAPGNAPGAGPFGSAP